MYPGHQVSLSIDSFGVMPPPCDPYSQVSSPSISHLGDVSDVDVEISTIIDDLRRTLRLMNHQAQKREVDMGGIVAILLETPRPLLDACTRQSIRQATSLADLVVLVSGDAVVPLNQTDSVAPLCVALAQSDQSSPVSRR